MSPVTRPRPARTASPPPGRAGVSAGLIWLTWRQHRWAIVGTLVLAAVLVGWMTYVSVETGRTCGTSATT